MAKFKERLTARKLRRKGLSFNTIAQRLQVSKGSVSTWCSDVELTKSQRQKLLQDAITAGHRGRIIGAQKNHQLKLDRIESCRAQGRKELQKLSQRERLIVGVSLYWGEGSKTDKFAFSNSDPTMVRFMCQWLQDVMEVDKEDLMPRIFINEIHRPRIRKILVYWTALLELPISQFGNPTFLKVRPRKVYENYDSYYGVVSLRVRKSTNLKYRILGLIEALRDS